jgi:GntR family transcriptional regulator
MFFKLNPTTGQPLYLQLMQQIRHAAETGALQDGDQLPGIRTLAEELVVSPNTVAKAYSELEHDGLLELLSGHFPWLGTLASLSAAALMLFASARAIQRREF